MKAKPIFSFFFSFILILNFSQKKQDSLQKKWKYEPNILLGFDVLNAGTAAFSDRKLFQGFISTNVKDKWYAVADLGFDKNSYQKNGYDVSASGAFLRLGALYMLANDKENPRNGFLTGAKVAGSFYKQEYKAVPIRGFAGSDISQSFPSSQQSSYWLEANLGGRVQLFELPLYIEVTVQPKYLVFSTTQENIKPMIVPGFGKSSSNFNMGFSWNIAYAF
jgi:hypothetical protein